MSSEDEYSEGEYSINEDEFDEEQEREGYDEESSSTRVNKEADLLNNKNYILSQKLVLLTKFNKGLLDPDIYYNSINKLNKELNEIEAYSGNVTNTFINKEYEFNNSINEYINKLKRGIKLTDEEIATLNTLQSELNNLLEEYLQTNEKIEPEVSLTNEYDADGFLVNWEAYEQAELKEAIGVAKNLKLRIKIPKRKDYSNEVEYSNAIDKFFKFMAPYLPTYVPKLNVTNIGVTYENIHKSSLMSQVKEDVKEVRNLGIVLSANEKNDIELLNNIKNELSNMDRSELIDCITSQDTTQNSTNYIDQLRFNKKPFLNYKPYVIKKKYSPKELLLNLLLNLGEDVSDELSSQHLEAILINKYKIPPSLYYKKGLEYSVSIIKRNGDEKKLLFKYNAANPILIVKKTPIPEGTLTSNETYYGTYIPINETLYSTLKKKNKSVQELWLVPFQLPDGNYILKKVDNFEDYLSEIKRMNELNINRIQSKINSEKNALKIANLEQVIEVLSDRLYQINEYINNKRILPPLYYRKDLSVPNIPGISYVTTWQRKVSIKKLEVLLFNSELINKLETVIYSANSRNVEEYLDKINNILFIFETYPSFKTKLINGEINVYQLATFDRDFMLNENSKNSNKPIIKTRILLINKLKNAFYKSIPDETFRNNKILKDILITRASKRIELLIFDLTINKNEYSNNPFIKKLDTNFKFNSSFAINVINNKIKNEKLLQIINSATPEQGSDVVNTTTTTKLNLKEIEALISQERVQLKYLNKEKYELNSINNSGVYIIYWNPPRNILTPNELLRWTSLLADARNKIKMIVDSESDLIGPKMDYNKIVERNITSLVKFKEVLMKKYKVKYDKKSYELDKLISKSEQKILILQEQRTKKIRLIYRVRKLLLNKNIQKNEKIVLLPKFPRDNINIDVIFELVQSHKRYLIIEDLKKVNASLNLNKLIQLLELFDLNTLNLRLNKIDNNYYNQISYKITTEINNILKEIKLKTDDEYVNQSIQDFFDALGMRNTITASVTDNMEYLLREWPENYSENIQVVPNNYSEDLIKKLLKVSNPFNLYNEFIIRDYSSIVSGIRSTYERDVPKSEYVQYDPSTGNIGKKAYNGYLFRAYRLNKDPYGQPVVLRTTREEENPRTGLYVTVPVTYEQPGNYYFIKIPVINPQNREDTFRWKEVPDDAVILVPDNYDTCSRFDNNQSECNTARGLGNSKCEYSENTRLCKANYSENVNNFGSPTGLSRWFKEKWVNVCKKEGNNYAKCGKSGKKYPYCRPSVRITSKTPKTVREIGKKKLAKICKRKKNKNRVTIN
jgi:hypothetical protein